MGTMEVLLVSPMKPIYIILAKAVPYFIISCVNLTTVLLLSVFVLGVPVAGSLFWLIMVSMLFIFVSLSLGLLVSTLTKTQLAAMLVSGMVFMMPVVLLSGMMFPVENMPGILQWISNIIPAKWYIISVKNIMIKGADVSSVFREIAVLLSMAAVIILLSLKNFKNRLE
jgi:ABC-2 type transport system permease protein